MGREGEGRDRTFTGSSHSVWWREGKREERREKTEVRQASHRGHESGDSGTKVGLDPPAAHHIRLST